MRRVLSDNSVTPSSLSSLAMCWLTIALVMPSTSAATENDPARTSATNTDKRLRLTSAMPAPSDCQLKLYSEFPFGTFIAAYQARMLVTLTPCWLFFHTSRVIVRRTPLIPAGEQHP